MLKNINRIHYKTLTEYIIEHSQKIIKRPVSLKHWHKRLETLRENIETLTENIETLTEKIGTLTEKIGTLAEKIGTLAEK